MYLILSDTFKAELIKIIKNTRKQDINIKSGSINLNLFEPLTINKKNKLNIKHCSTGEQKMALITILIAQKTDRLLLDEVSSFLDNKNYNKVWNILKKRKIQIISTSTSPLNIENIDNINLSEFN